MQLYDISQEVFSCRVYPGDPSPRGEALCRMDSGDSYNLSAFSMCAHNGTHVDVPFHFFREGDTIDKVPLEHFVGRALVVCCQGTLTAQTAKAILEKAGGIPRILLKGSGEVTLEAAEVFGAGQILLLGVESQSVGPEAAPMAVHKALLGHHVTLLEGICLDVVAEGVYFLSAAPLNLKGFDGAPCRAVLLELPNDKEELQ